MAALGLVAAAAVASAATVDSDSGTDLAGLARELGGQLARLRWQFTGVVVVLAGLHYLATAVAARAAAGVPLPLGETVLVQLAAAAANRLTPAGLGGSALTARYFTRRGMPVQGAVGAVGALAVLGALADLLVLCALALAGASLGLTGSTQLFRRLVGHVTGLLGPIRSPWLWLAVAVAGGTALGAWLVRHHGGRAARWAPLWAPLRAPLRRLARQPRSLAALLAASGATTLLLGCAFVATTRMLPGPPPAEGSGALLIAFMLGSAAGSAVPVPAGLGSTEAALVVVLVSARVPTPQAIEQVLIFRLITFWAPALLGVLATRHLHRRRAL